MFLNIEYEAFGGDIRRVDLTKKVRKNERFLLHFGLSNVDFFSAPGMFIKKNKFCFIPLLTQPKYSVEYGVP